MLGVRKWIRLFPCIDTHQRHHHHDLDHAVDSADIGAKLMPGLVSSSLHFSSQLISSDLNARMPRGRIQEDDDERSLLSGSDSVDSDSDSNSSASTHEDDHYPAKNHKVRSLSTLVDWSAG